MAPAPKTGKDEGRQDTEGRPVLTEEDEKKRHDEETNETPIDLE
jgi:hypothetical protein